MDTHELRSLEASIVDSIKPLQRALRTAARTARVFELPRAQKTDEPALQQLESSGTMPYTPVTTVDGRMAIDTAIASLRTFYGDDAQSTRFVFRLPGVVAVEPSAIEPLQRHCEHVNALKARFEDLVASIPRPDDRFDIVHAALPYLIVLQLTRRLRVVETPIKRIGFSWATKQSAEKLTKEQVDNKLDYAVRHYEGASPAGFQQHVAIVREKLAEGGRYRIRRTLKPRPVCNLSLVEGRPRQFDGYLPIIVPYSETLKMGVLNSYDPAAPKRKPRSDKSQGECLSEHFRLYQA